MKDSLKIQSMMEIYAEKENPDSLIELFEHNTFLIEDWEIEEYLINFRSTYSDFLDHYIAIIKYGMTLLVRTNVISYDHDGYCSEETCETDEYLTQSEKYEFNCLCIADYYIDSQIIKWIKIFLRESVYLNNDQRSMEFLRSINLYISPITKNIGNMKSGYCSASKSGRKHERDWVTNVKDPNCMALPAIIGQIKIRMGDYCNCEFPIVFERLGDKLKITKLFLRFVYAALSCLRPKLPLNVCREIITYYLSDI